MIVSDLMDGAQGFASCTDHPLSVECETAVSGVVDRIKVCHEAWKVSRSVSCLINSPLFNLFGLVDVIFRDYDRARCHNPISIKQLDRFSIP